MFTTSFNLFEFKLIGSGYGDVFFFDKYEPIEKKRYHETTNQSRFSKSFILTIDLSEQWTRIGVSQK
jgi:hypothetical protein